MAKEAIVFVPGVFGTDLTWSNGQGGSEPIWPPGLQDILGYARFDFLNDANANDGVVGPILDSIVPPLYPVYSSVMSVLYDISRGRGDADVIPVPYDWRRDLAEAAGAVSVAIDTYVTNHDFDRVTFVAHSMGGLVVRLLLENIVPSLENPPFWCSLKRRALFACAPHLGAPKALLYAMGQSGDSTLKPSQCNRLFANDAFLAGCQLLPSSQRQLLHDNVNDRWLDYKSPDVIAKFGLSSQNIGASDALRQALAIPTGADYLFVFGTGLPTDNGLDMHGLTLQGATPIVFDGDGTVPRWSIEEAAKLANPPVELWSTPGEHLGLLSTPAFVDKLHRYFDLPRADASALATNAAVSIHCNGRQFKPGENIKIMLTASGPFNGTVTGYGISINVSGDGSRSPYYFDAKAPNRPGPSTVEFQSGGQSLAQHWFFVESDDPSAGASKVAPSS